MHYKDQELTEIKIILVIFSYLMIQGQKEDGRAWHGIGATLEMPGKVKEMCLQLFSSILATSSALVALGLKG